MEVKKNEFKIGDIVYCPGQIEPRMGKIIEIDNFHSMKIVFRPKDYLWIENRETRHATKEEEKQYLLNQFVDWSWNFDEV